MLLLLYPSLHLLPGMCAKEEAVSHRVHHLQETTEGYGEAQLILPHPGTDRRIEKADETPMALPLVLHHGHGNNRTASRPEQ